MTISYTRTFSHTDWVDNVDRVQAGGDNGFNGRFHSVEAEFDSISGVVTAFSNALDALSQVPTAKPVNMTLVPILTQVGNAGWRQDASGVSKPAGATDANGVMNVTFPAGAVLQSFRAVGFKAGGTLGINVSRQTIGATVPQRVTGIDAPQLAFDQTAQITNADLAKINNDMFVYSLTAELGGAASTDAVSITAFQFTYVLH